ncbi:Dual specificity protein phosphatase 8, partial [Penaeus vannamei]
MPPFLSAPPGGFLEFQARFPELCEDSSKKCTPLTTQSQPCLPVSNVGPTRILPFLYLGSQHDANNKQLLSDHNILYELNVSVSCPKPDFVQESHFMRIAVNDNFSEKLLPYFNDAFNFIDKVRESGGCVLVHCLAGISRSATVAIAYVMKHLRLPFDEAYMYVKTRRPTISPNINFVGQLAELDRQLRRDAGQRDPTSAPILFRSHESHSSGSSTASISSSAAFASTYLERHACSGLQSNMPKSLSLNLRSTLEAVPASPSSSPHSPDMSPSSALARLSFASALDELHDDGLPATPKCPSPATPISCLPPSSPATAIVRDSNSSPVFSYRKTSSSSPTSPAFSSFYKSKEVSSRTSSDYRSEAKITDGEARQVSVCVIDVKREKSPVSFVRREPLVVRETQVIATPCHVKPEVRSVLEVQLEDGRQKEEHITVKEGTRKTAEEKTSKENNKKNQEDKKEAREESVLTIESCRPPPKEEAPARPREVIVPIQIAGAREGRPRVLELSSPREASVAGPPTAATPNSPHSPGVQQSDSGIIVEEERGEIPPSPQRLPRCYSSSETHLNTRRLLEHRNPDFTARKCSSYDEVGRAWPHSQHPQPHQQGVGRESTTWLCPWELARSDSVSTSGFGSEISDTDLLHDDAHSTTTQEDALGPYDAVFADVFPGEQVPKQQPTTPKTPRPASLPGVTGAYFSHFEVRPKTGHSGGSRSRFS